MTIASDLFAHADMKPTLFSLHAQSLHGSVQALTRACAAFFARLPRWATQRLKPSPADSAPFRDELNTRPPGERRAVTRPAALALPALVPKTHRDALTGLPTRAYLDEAGDELLLPLAAPGFEACVLCLQVTGLAPLVDRYGHAVSDAVHRQLAIRLRRLLRRSDTLIRMEGNRYLMLMSTPVGEGSTIARAMASRAMADVQRPLTYRTLSTLRVDCCTGAAIQAVADRAALSQQIAHADEILQSAMAIGPGQFRQRSAD